jgi:hypothetical protein
MCNGQRFQVESIESTHKRPYTSTVPHYLFNHTQLTGQKCLTWPEKEFTKMTTLGETEKNLVERVVHRVQEKEELKRTKTPGKHNFFSAHGKRPRRNVFENKIWRGGEAVFHRNFSFR